MAGVQVYAVDAVVGVDGDVGDERESSGDLSIVAFFVVVGAAVVVIAVAVPGAVVGVVVVVVVVEPAVAVEAENQDESFEILVVQNNIFKIYSNCKRILK